MSVLSSPLGRQGCGGARNDCIPHPQYPSTRVPPACKGLDFAPDTEGLGSFAYAMANGNVPFYATDLKNSEVGPFAGSCMMLV